MSDTTPSSETTQSGADAAARGKRKVRVGTVVSDKQHKSIVVRVDRQMAHPKYRKTLSRSKRYHAHDEDNQAKVGDRVEITETRPLSKLKRWRLVRVLQRSATSDVLTAEKED